MISAQPFTWEDASVALWRVDEVDAHGITGAGPGAGTASGAGAGFDAASGSNLVAASDSSPVAATDFNAGTGATACACAPVREREFACARARAVSSTGAAGPAGQTPPEATTLRAGAHVSSTVRDLVGEPWLSWERTHASVCSRSASRASACAESFSPSASPLCCAAPASADTASRRRYFLKRPSTSHATSECFSSVCKQLSPLPRRTVKLCPPPLPPLPPPPLPPPPPPPPPLIQGRL
eukprot:6210125-Pleurochrysis_carterae.AAC.2